MALQPANRGKSGSRGRYRPMSEINVTPFVDVMLVLLVVFMVTAPLLVLGIPVQLPKVGKEFIISDRIHNRTAGRHRERIAAVSRSVRAEHHAARSFLRGETSAKRETPADTLSRSENVRLNSVLLIGIERAGASYAALHLVKDQHQIVLIS